MGACTPPTTTTLHRPGIDSCDHNIIVIFFYSVCGSVVESTCWVILWQLAVRMFHTTQVSRGSLVKGVMATGDRPSVSKVHVNWGLRFCGSGEWGVSGFGYRLTVRFTHACPYLPRISHTWRLSATDTSLCTTEMCICRAVWMCSLIKPWQPYVLMSSLIRQ